MEFQAPYLVYFATILRKAGGVWGEPYYTPMRVEVFACAGGEEGGAAVFSVVFGWSKMVIVKNFSVL